MPPFTVQDHSYQVTFTPSLMRNTVFYTVLDNLEIFFRCGLEAANREFGDTTDAYRLIDGAFFIDDFISV